MKHEIWQNCYDAGWQEGDIIPDAFSHPAKMAKGLVYRIVKTGLERHWWVRETLIVDPFGGIGSTGLACSAFGIRSVLVELEEKFVSLSRENFALHEKDWQAMGYPAPQIIQGDSRRLLEIFREVGGGITSPPYISLGKQGGLNTLPSQKEGQQTGRSNDSPSQIGGQSGYGTTPGQLGAMKEGEGPVGAITSPPYIDRAQEEHGSIDWEKAKTGGNPKSQLRGRSVAGSYGNTPGQISSMKEGSLGGITSPPFAPPHRNDAERPGRIGEVDGRMYRTDNLEHPANIANLPIGALTSPPYEEGLGHKRGNAGRTREATGNYTQGYTQGVMTPEYYSNGDSNLGNQRGDTYWGACRLIYEQLYQLFNPGSHLVVVVKSFVRNKKIVDLPGMTLALLEDIGFESVAWIDAKLAEEGTQSSAFPELVAEKQRKRVSFFRRLHERKYPHLALNEEVVLVVRK